jgi:cysteine synthase A
VVLFALEWCEFCWSVRKMVAQCEIPFVSVDLDSVPFQEDERGVKIRAVLQDITASKTIPQIFIGGEYVGGCTEVFDAYKSGELRTLLDAVGVEYLNDENFDPYTLLPGWLHPR